MIRPTEAPIKYLLASSILKTTEDPSIKWQAKDKIGDPNVTTLLQILDATIHSLEEGDNANKNKWSLVSDSKGESQANNAGQQIEKLETQKENFLEFRHNARKFCLLAMTNILLKTNSRHFFELSTRNNQRRMHEVIMKFSSFEHDPQMNLRFLTLTLAALEQGSDEKLQSMDTEVT